MIYLDIETSGMNINTNQILSIGAINFNNERNTFYSECYLEENKSTAEEALKINGFTREQIRDKNKDSLKNLLIKFIDWLESIGQKEKCVVIGQNVFFDKYFIDYACEEQNISFKLSHRVIDLQSCVYTYCKLNNISTPSITISSSDIAKILNLPQEAKPHNALNGAKQNLIVYKKLFSKVEPC